MVKERAPRGGRYDRRIASESRLRVVAFALVAPVLLGALGCCCGLAQRGQSGYVPVGAYEPEQPNPLFVKTQDAEALWDAIVDVIDNYFIIERENPVRTYERSDANGKTYVYQTEGRLDTKPSILGGVQEPWRNNRAPNCDDRWFATFQTARTQATVRVVPEDSGFFVYLSVYEEIEDMPRPMGSNIGYNLSFVDDMSQLAAATGERGLSKGWIPIGRDTELETRIMKELAWRVGNPRTIIHEGIDAKLQP